MVHPAAMNRPYKDAMLTADERDAIKIAQKSSRNVVSMDPGCKFFSFPIPEDLKMAIELDKDDDRLTERAKEYSQILLSLREFRNVQQNHYWFLMKLLIYLDHYQSIANMTQYSLYKQKLRLSKYNKGNVVLYVPGLAEDRPSVRTKDMVIIREVNGDNYSVGTVTSVGEKYLTTNIDSRFLKKFSEEQEYNIFFLFPDYCLNCNHFALDRASKFDLIPMLFPSGESTKKLQNQQSLEWINPNIGSNPEQQQAVVQILARSAFPAPYILFGPPGTGKTSTLVEAIGQILKRKPSNRILVCTPSNAAADEIAQRLLKNNVDGHSMHRMYSLSRDGKDISDALKPYSNFSDDSALFVSKEILITKKVVVATLITCHRLISYNLRESHFSYVFVDEAGQATEPETLIPMTLMSSSEKSHKGRLHGQFVIAGDPKQLGPSVMSRLAEPILGRSMLERLMDWDLYRKDENNKFNPSYVTKLVQNYRCHPAILHVPNELFYDGELKACGGKHTERAVLWHKLPKAKFPIIFHATKGNEQRESNSPSVFNAMEVSTVISYVKDLLGANLGGRRVLQKEIGIVTPYKLQRQKIDAELSKLNLADISVGTVETFQGQEKDVMIVSTVRSALYRHNGRIHIGFLSNPKRFNVALTRAKALLIVIGHPVILQVDEYWRRFITYCFENGACRGSTFSLNQCLSTKKVQNLLARKHVPHNDWDTNMPFEVVEEEPVERLVYRIPELSATRRRRLPPCFASINRNNRNKSSCNSSEASFDENCNNSLKKYIGKKEDNYLNRSKAKDEFEMEEYFADESEQISFSTSRVSSMLKHPELAWDTTSTSTSTDRSDQTPDFNEVNDKKPIVMELFELMSKIEI